MKPFVNFAILVAIILGSLVWLALGGVKETQTYYKSIPELQKSRLAGDVFASPGLASIEDCVSGNRSAA
jgi:hypothetical protein